MYSTWVSFSLLLVAILFCGGQGKLILLQTLFRHGDRSPTHLYPNDPNPESTWPEGLGMLTQLGRLQHYMLGKNIRSLYSYFITSNPNEVVVNSTGIDRCLRSAESHVAGLYEPSPEYQFVPGFDWQPIPIHYLDKKLDKYLNPKVKCPKSKAAEERIYNSPQFRKYRQENMPMLMNLSECSGQNLTDKKARALAETIRIEMEYNKEVPSCMYPWYQQLQDYGDGYGFAMYQSPIVQKFRAGPFIGRIFENMQKKINGEVPELKVKVFSARDRNLLALLHALGAFNGKSVPYAATLLFELHEQEGQHHAVRMLMMNSTRPQDGNQSPHVLRILGCDELCPLDEFEKRTKHLVPKNFHKECNE